MGRIINISSQSRITAPDEWLAPPLEVLECAVYRGPHLYSHTPMIRIQVDLGVLEAWPTHRLRGFPDRLLEKLPGLWEHGCSAGRCGGFVERLKEGTWLGHVIEHVALELQASAGFSVTRGKTRSVRGKPGRYNIMFAYASEDAGRCAGRYALDIIASILEPPFHRFRGLEKVYPAAIGESFSIPAALAELTKLANAAKLGPTTQSLVDEAERRNIPWMKIDGQSLIQFGTGRARKLVRASITSATSNIAVETAGDKDLAKSILSEAGIPVPKGVVVRNVEDAVVAAMGIGFPVVLKPLNGNHGRGVSTHLKQAGDVAEAFAMAREHARQVIVEKHFPGRDYRALVIDGKLIAVAERVPAHVVGDGSLSIEQLIAAVNADPRRGEGHANVMTRIEIDETLKAMLMRANLDLASVPAKNKCVVLAATANLSTGGTAIDRTDEIHPDNASIARRAATVVGLDVAGIDLVLPDIAKSWRETGGGIVEVNACPGFRMHLHPSEGKARNVAEPVLASLFPPGSKTRIPTVAITGTNGKSTTTRMVTQILRQAGMDVGFTSTSGVFINDECVWKGDASGPKSARLLLREPSIDAAVFETARGGILREGLGVNEYDVGAVLNVTADHLGIGGVNSLEDLAAVKSIVTESVHRHGVSVLNADDPLTFAMARHAGGSVCYFSRLPAESSLLRAHLNGGGRAVTCELIGGIMQLVLHRNGRSLPIIGVANIPATLGGCVTFNIENALAAAAIGCGLDIDTKVISSALARFGSTFEQNPGRLNIHDGHGFRVVMDYAHNPAALQALFKALRVMRESYGRVIGTLSTPGDRRDEDIREVGRIGGTELDLVVFRELPDNRGRPIGEVIRLLAEGAQSAGCPGERIICVHPEEEATAICLSKARPGDLVILTPSKVEATWRQVLEFKPAALTANSWHKGAVESEDWRMNA